MRPNVEFVGSEEAEKHAADFHASPRHGIKCLNGQDANLIQYVGLNDYAKRALRHRPDQGLCLFFFQSSSLSLPVRAGRFFFFVALLRFGRGFDRADQDMGVAAFEPRHPFHRAKYGQILGKSDE